MEHRLAGLEVNTQPVETTVLLLLPLPLPSSLITGTHAAGQAKARAESHPRSTQLLGDAEFSLSDAATSMTSNPPPTDPLSAITVSVCGAKRREGRGGKVSRRGRCLVKGCQA